MRRNLRNINLDNALRANEYYSFRRRDYTSIGPCASAAHISRKFPAGAARAPEF
jgi:hypothetical protein